jgi:SAM-dependent methyltransferase
MLLPVSTFLAPREESAGEPALPATHGRLFVPYRADQLSYVILKGAADRPATAQDLPVPPPHLLLGHADAAQFLSWGEQHFSTMEGILRRSGYAPARGQRILDFGCGSGRLIRWLRGVADDSEIWGVDIRAEHVLWCREHLQPPFHFAVTTVVPHLPFEDRYFDLIHAGSVFTHIDDLVDSWLLELRRLLKPGGRLYLTIHDNTSVAMLKNELREQREGRLFNASAEFVEYSGQDFACFTLGRSDDSQVFYDLTYFCGIVSSLYTVLAVVEKAYGHQTAILLQKPGPGERPEPAASPGLVAPQPPR